MLPGSLRSSFCSAAEASRRRDEPLVPVYRAAPFKREQERRARGPRRVFTALPARQILAAHTHSLRCACFRSNMVRVLFASEWNVCRSVLAGAGSVADVMCSPQKH